ncbi:MAG: hypothetical protein LVR00_05155 [Rhabdochlamydiaceae bacterium]|jgi:UDP-3-O-[3-hydroxymyristoyl] glucosamine N-acyltransferase
MKSFTLQELADLTKSKLVGDSSYKITGVEDLEAASSGEISFCANTRYAPLIAKTQAGAICVDPQTPLIQGKTFSFLIPLLLHFNCSLTYFFPSILLYRALKAFIPQP